MSGDGQRAGVGHALVVVALDADLVAEDVVHPRAWRERDVVDAEDPGFGAVALVTDDIRQVLLEASPGVHRHDLQTAADPEHGQVALQRAVDEGELAGVAVISPSGGLGVRCLPVALRVEVGAACQHQSVEQLEHLRVGAGRRREHDRQPTGCRAPGRRTPAGISTAGWSQTPHRACSR